MILQKPRMTSSNHDIYGFNPYGSVASIFQDNWVITRAVEAFLHHQNIDKHLLRWLKTFSWKMYPTHSRIFHENVFNHLNIKRMKICIFVLFEKKSTNHKELRKSTSCHHDGRICCLDLMWQMPLLMGHQPELSMSMGYPMNTNNASCARHQDAAIVFWHTVNLTQHCPIIRFFFSKISTP